MLLIFICFQLFRHLHLFSRCLINTFVGKLVSTKAVNSCFTKSPEITDMCRQRAVDGSRLYSCDL